MMNYQAIDEAINLIIDGKAVRISVQPDIIVYKVPSNNPDKYVIRIDIKKG